MSKEYLEMSPWDFDQSPSGWRRLEAEKKYLEAARLIQTYINKNQDKVSKQVVGDEMVDSQLLNFHVAQLLASAGEPHYEEAIEILSETTYDEDDKCWNAYVSATIGFLSKDLSTIDNSIAIISNAKDEDKTNGNLGIIKNFRKALEMGEYDYDTVYQWPRE